MNIAPLRGGAVVALAFFIGGCGYINFNKPMSDEEYILRSEIRTYYEEVGTAFLGGNAEALVGLYDDTIAVPMTRDQILAWAKDFFQKHGPANFKIVNVDIEAIGHVSADVVLTYRVDTSDGQGSFHGVERDHFLRHGRRWYIASWEKLPDASAR